MSCPALRRLFAMGSPIVPRPRKPIRMRMSLLLDRKRAGEKHSGTGSRAPHGIGLARRTVLCKSRRGMADLIVAGGGISGLALAWKAAASGKRVLVLEREARVGGCFHSHRRPDGFWFEMGAHTTYNSYGAFLDVVVGTGLAGDVVPRGPARKVFGLLRGDDVRWLTPPKVLLELSWLEAAVHFPAGIARKKAGETMYSYYSRLVGRRNYDRILSAFFAAVPSQKADGFPVQGPGSLFKKRPRREELPRSFGLKRGLQSVCDAAAAVPGVTVETGVDVTRVARAPGGFAVTAADGRRVEAPLCAVAVPP